MFFIHHCFFFHHQSNFPTFYHLLLLVILYIFFTTLVLMHALFSHASFLLRAPTTQVFLLLCLLSLFFSILSCTVCTYSYVFLVTRNKWRVATEILWHMNADILFHIWCATFFDYAPPQNFLEFKEVVALKATPSLFSKHPIVCSAFSYFDAIMRACNMIISTLLHIP